MDNQPLYFLQIVDRQGIVARIPGGGSLEADLTSLITQHIMSRGVGFLKSSAHVEQDIRDGIREAIMGLKMQTRFIQG